MLPSDVDLGAIMTGAGVVGSASIALIVVLIAYLFAVGREVVKRFNLDSEQKTYHDQLKADHEVLQRALTERDVFKTELDLTKRQHEEAISQVSSLKTEVLKLQAQISQLSNDLNNTLMSLNLLQRQLDDKEAIITFIAKKG